MNPTAGGESHIRLYDFFGRVVRVDSDGADVTAVLDAVYERQRLDGADGAAVDLDVRVRSRGEAGPRIEVAGRTVRAPDEAHLPHFAHLVLVNAAAASCEDARVLHGGAVTRDGRAALILAPSGGGKSTLTLELVRRGWRLLSDDFAVLADGGSVRPFPRRVNLTDDSMAILGLTPPGGAVRIASFGGREKWMIDIETLFPDSLGRESPVGAVFVVVPSFDTVDGGAGAPDGERVVWRIELDHCPPSFERRLAALPGVVDVGSPSAGGSPVIEMTVEPGARIVRDLDALCAEHDVAVLYARRGRLSGFSFDRPPEARPVALTDAMPGILAHDLSLSGHRFLFGSQRAATHQVYFQLLRSLAATSPPVPIHMMRPGPLEQTADLVETSWA